MNDTMFTRRNAAARIAPTESCTPFGWPCDGPGTKMLRGVVHDPTARRMDGVAGHAGLFSTAADLAVFCRMLLTDGSFRGIRVLVAAHRREDDDPGGDGRGSDGSRALGWDIDSSFSSNRGSCCRSDRSGTPASPARRCGSTPPPGCSWCSCRTGVHPDGKGDVTPLRARVATVAASAIIGDGPLGAPR